MTESVINYLWSCTKSADDGWACPTERLRATITTTMMMTMMMIILVMKMTSARKSYDDEVFTSVDDKLCDNK